MQQQFTHWYLVYTRPRCEKKVADIFKRKNLESFCPLNKIQKNPAEPRKFSTELLFPAKVFVRLSEHDFAMVRKIDDVINFVYWLGQPARIPEEEVATVRHFTEDYRNITITKTSINTSDTVRMITSPIISQKGQVVSVKSTCVKVVLPSLGCTLQAEPDLSRVNIIPAAAALRTETSLNALAAR